MSDFDDTVLTDDDFDNIKQTKIEEEIKKILDENKALEDEYNKKKKAYKTKLEP